MILYFASIHGNLQIIKYLVETVKFDINEQDDDGVAAIHICCHRRRQEALEYLISKGADIEIKFKSKNADKNSKPIITPLSLAIHQDLSACTEILLKHGAKICFFLPKTVAPYMQEYIDKLNPSIQNIINKYIQWRETRLLISMVDIISNKFD